jgi:hypothetical protein
MAEDFRATGGVLYSKMVKIGKCGYRKRSPVGACRITQTGKSERPEGIEGAVSPLGDDQGSDSPRSETRSPV